jgi:hypothetical protein
VRLLRPSAMQAVNVFERWLSGLRRVAVTGGVATFGAPGRTMKAEAISCVVKVLKGLDGWVKEKEGQGGKEGTDAAALEGMSASEQGTFEVCLLFHVVPDAWHHHD